VDAESGIEGLGGGGGALLKAVNEREAAIKRREAQLRGEQKPARVSLPDFPSWVRDQLHAMPRSESMPSKYPISCRRKYVPGVRLGRPMFAA
jgi:hypothetical protein